MLIEKCCCCHPAFFPSNISRRTSVAPTHIIAMWFGSSPSLLSFLQPHASMVRKSTFLSTYYTYAKHGTRCFYLVHFIYHSTCFPCLTLIRLSGLSTWVHNFWFHIVLSANFVYGIHENNLGIIEWPWKYELYLGWRDVFAVVFWCMSTHVIVWEGRENGFQLNFLYKNFWQRLGKKGF